MPKKSMTSELSEILESLPHLSSGELEVALERLGILGVEVPEGPIRRPGISCPIMQLPIVTICNLVKCSYHIENEWSRNCLLEYMDSQDSESLAVEEIAFLYQASPKRVEETISRGMAELRETSMKTLGFSGDFHKPSAPEIRANVDEEESFEISHATLAPPFMGKANEALESAVPAETVFRHPAIKILGVLDRIISELE